MKFLALTLVAGMTLAAPAFAQTTGSMAYPAPQPQGNVGTTAPGGGGSNGVAGATGSMAYPAPQPQGTLSSQTPSNSVRTDTGSMAYPAPLPQGNLSTTTTPAR